MPEDDLGELVEILTNCSPAVSGGDGRLSVILTIDAATDPSDAIVQARAAWHSALLDIGLTFRDVVDVDVRAATYDEVERELSAPTIPELWGAHEAAQYLGVSRQRIHQLSTGNRAFPVAVVRIGLGPLWTRSSIEAFVEAWDRRSGRPTMKRAGGASVTMIGNLVTGTTKIKDVEVGVPAFTMGKVAASRNVVMGKKASPSGRATAKAAPRRIAASKTTPRKG